MLGRLARDRRKSLEPILARTTGQTLEALLQRRDYRLGERLPRAGCHFASQPICLRIRYI